MTAAALMDRLRAAVRAVRARSDRIPRLALAIAPAAAGSSPAGPDSAFAPLRNAIADPAAVPAAELGGILPEDGPPLLLGRLEGAVAVAWSVSDGDADVRARGLPVRLARLLGADVLCVVGSARALGPLDASLALVSDHLNLLGDNPLVGPNLDELGPRFPDLTEPYDPALREVARAAAATRGIALGEGVLAAVGRDVPPANLPLPPEYLLLRELGADLAGPAAVPEVIVARHMGMRALALLTLRPGAHAAAHAAGIVRALAARLD